MLFVRLMGKGMVMVMTIGMVLTSDCPAHIGLAMVIHITTPWDLWIDHQYIGHHYHLIMTVKTPPRLAFDWWEYAG